MHYFEKYDMNEDLRQLKFETEEVCSNSEKYVCEIANEALKTLTYAVDSAEKCHTDDVLLNVIETNRFLSDVDKRVGFVIANKKHVKTGELFALNEFNQRSGKVLRGIVQSIEENCECKRK